ncbi:Protein of uncharacterised function (DUF1602) [Mycobacterium tuberculosis]|nr:Protein of uncharacterised function (DUF1602) [Mycobacterium tuberculosis]
MINERAMATRCIWPPDNSEGLWLIRLPSPTSSSSSHASLRATFIDDPSRTLGMATFSQAVKVGSRLKNWKMKETLRRRYSDCWSSLLSDSSSPSTLIEPASGRSMPPMRCSKVLLPEPDAPVMATRFSLPRVSVTSSTALTSSSPR